MHIRTELSDKQREALDILKRSPRFILADSTGTGKTLSMLSAYSDNMDENSHMLVFANKTAVVTWASEIRKHTDFRPLFVTGECDLGTVLNLDHDITIVTYGAITTCAARAEIIKTLIQIYEKKRVFLVLEEAHYCKNPKTVRYQTVLPFVRNAAYCWAITATPMVNDLMDLYWLFDLLLPGYLGARNVFEARYVVTKMKEAWKKRNKYGGKVKYKEVQGYKNLEELKERIKPYLLKRVQNYHVEFHMVKEDFRDDEEQAYLLAAQGLLGIQDYREFAARLPDLQRIVDNSTDIERTKNESTRLATKEIILLTRLKEQLDSGEGVIVYVDFHDTLDRLKYVFQNVRGFAFRTLFTLDGSDTLNERIRIQQNFGPGDILLMTSAGKESLNLQQSHTLWLYDIPFSLGSTLQVIGRIARMDSKFEQFDVFLPVISNTIDEYKAASLLHNSDLFSSVLTGEKTLPKSRVSLNKAEIIKMRKHMLWRMRPAN